MMGLARFVFHIDIQLCLCSTSFHVDQSSWSSEKLTFCFSLAVSCKITRADQTSRRLRVYRFWSDVSPRDKNTPSTKTICCLWNAWGYADESAEVCLLKAPSALHSAVWAAITPHGALMRRVSGSRTPVTSSRSPALLQDHLFLLSSRRDFSSNCLTPRVWWSSSVKSCCGKHGSLVAPV